MFSKKGQNRAIGIIFIIIIVFIAILVLVDFIDKTGEATKTACGDGFYFDNGICKQIPVKEKIVEKVVYVPSEKSYNPIGIALIIAIGIVIAAIILRWKK